MLIFLRTMGVDYRAQRSILDVVKTFPFSSAKKRMSTLVRSSGNEGHLYTKGASEIITGMCQSYMAKDGSTQSMNEQMRVEIMEQITTMASAGLRTIGIAYCPVSNLEATKMLEDAPGSDMAMIFIGIVGIRDPPRKVTMASTLQSYLHIAHIPAHSTLSHTNERLRHFDLSAWSRKCRTLYASASWLASRCG